MAQTGLCLLPLHCVVCIYIYIYTSYPFFFYTFADIYQHTNEMKDTIIKSKGVKCLTRIPQHFKMRVPSTGQIVGQVKGFDVGDQDAKKNKLLT